MNRLVYFEITGECLLNNLASISDIPRTARLIRVESVPQRSSPLNEPSNIMRFIIEDESFAEQPEGARIPRIEPIHSLDARVIFDKEKKVVGKIYDPYGTG